MKSLFLLPLLVIASCSAYTDELKSWSFVQSVGGIAIYTPYKEKGTYYLPIKVDVSGIQEITRRPTILNSALMCSRTGYLLIGNEIRISIYTSVANKAAGKNCKSIPLPGIQNGKYAVYYSTDIDGNHLLGNITISPNKTLDLTSTKKEPQS